MATHLVALTLRSDMFDFLPEHSPYLEEKRHDRNREMFERLFIWGLVFLCFAVLLLVL